MGVSLSMEMGSLSGLSVPVCRLFLGGGVSVRDIPPHTSTTMPSYVHKCVVFCSWVDQGVGLCKTYLPLCREMGSVSLGLLSQGERVSGVSMAETPKR